MPQQPDCRSMDSRKPNHDRDRHSSRGSGDHDDSDGELDHTEEDEEEEEEEEGEEDGEEVEEEDENQEGQSRDQHDEVREMAMVALSLLKQESKVMLQQVKQLVKAKSQLASQVFTTDVDGWTPIHACALRGKKKVLKAMLRSGIDVNVRMGQPEGLPAGCSLLHIAANRQDKKVVDYLLHHGAQVNAGDSFGRTPLFYANRSGNKDAAKLLTEAGAKCENVGKGDGAATSTPDVRVEEVRTSLSDDLVLETPEPKLSRFCFLPLPQHHHHHRGKRSGRHRRQNQQQQQHQQEQRGQTSYAQNNANGHRTS